MASRPAAAFLIVTILMALSCHSKADLKEITKEGKITLKNQGKDLPLTVEVMDVFLADPDYEDKYPEKFHLRGPDIELVGSFPMEVRVGYGEEFKKMIHHTVFISDVENPDGHEERHSKITLPDAGELQVRGGTIVVQKVLGQNPDGAGQIISGRVRLDLDNGNSMDGEFVFLAKTWG